MYKSSKLDLEAFGIRVRAAREAANFSVQDLAARLGVERSTVAEWETGGRPMDLLQLRDFCRAVRASADFLLFGPQWFERGALMGTDLAAGARTQG